MDNDTLSNNTGGAGAAPDAPATPEVGAAPSGTTDLGAGGAPASEPSVTLPEPPAAEAPSAAEPASSTDTAAGLAGGMGDVAGGADAAASTPAPESPATDVAAGTPLVDTSAMDTAGGATPLVSPNIAAAGVAGATDGAAGATAPANPLAADANTGGALDASAPLVNTNPILANAPEAKASPILNSAPAVIKKFDMKYLIPIIVLGVMVLGLGGFLIYEEVVGKPNAVKEAGNAKPVINTTEVVGECTDDAEASPITVPFESDQSLNTTDNVYTLVADTGKGVVVATGDDDTTVVISVDWTEAKTGYADLKLSGTGSNDYTIEFSNAPVTIYYAGAVGDSGDEYLLLLMEDGTVQYINISKGLAAKEFESKRASKVTEVVRFVSATAGSGTAVLAQKSDGTYYDLTSLVAS